MLVHPVDSIDQYLTVFFFVFFSFFFSQQSFIAVGTVPLIIKVKPQNLHCVVSKTLMLENRFVSESKACFFSPNTDRLKLVKYTNKHPSQNRQTFFFFSSVSFLIERKAIQPQDMLCFE